MNFLISAGGQLFVLRRPPEGPIPPGANDMAREFRILSHLHPVFPLVPRAHLFCSDPQVIGAPFQLMEYRPGLVVGAKITSDTISNWNRPEPIGQHLGGEVIRVLNSLHQVDVRACGLEDLGRPAGFLTRTLRGWSKRAALSWKDSPNTLLPALLDWLQTNLPPETDGATLIHNDFKLDNIILDPATLRPRTLIDWDMGTLGDPLYDLAVLLSYWPESGDPAVMHALRQMPTAGHGFASRAEAADLYVALSGRDLGNFVFFRVLATLRIAVVFQQLYQRNCLTENKDPRAAGFNQLALDLLAFGMQIARGRYF
ncbi:phosphotransferase family protein [Paracoccus aestuarii]|uniref:Phosphotransferase family protein n=2 Tax=Paracoccus aestuarii TaxID=453842 RepID=A0A418ZYD8_9RHOB|nr:phosphotransferase family protein [Paracoccus aestuarii]